MKKPDSPIFLERRTYRKRRLIDALRLLPILGAVLWGIPMFLGQDAQNPVSVSGVMIYIFVVWIALIIACFALVRRIGDTDQNWDHVMSGDETSD